MALTIVQEARSTGNVNSQNQKPDISSVLTKIMPYQTPVTQYLFFGPRKSEVCTNAEGKFEYFEDELLPHNLTVLADVALTGDDLVFTAANLADVKALNLYTPVIMEETGEQGWVTDITSGSYTVSRMMDGEDTTVTALTALTLAAAADVKIIGGPIVEEGSTGTDPRTTQVIKQQNRLTIFEETIITTDREQAGAQYTPVKTAYQVKKKMLEMKMYLERWFSMGLVEGYITSATGGKRRTYGKGFKGLITTNVSNYASLDEDELFGHMKLVGAKGNGKKTHYAGSDQFYEIQDIVRAKIGNLDTPVTKTYGVKALEFLYADVELDLIHNPVYDSGYANTGFTIDQEYLRPRHMAPDEKGSRKFRMRRNVQENNANLTEVQLLADVGYELRFETAHGVLEKS